MGTAPKPPKGDPPPPLQVGDVVLERYRLDEHIASGGHSVVYRGTDERLSRPVCVKVFSGLGGKSGVGRTSYEHFVQEAFALSRLTHPNTLRIYDFGHLGAKDAEGMPLQVCEYMNGGTLSQIVREQGKQSLEQTAAVISAMCAALSEAHALGIVHRDIKPQNILFGTVGGTRLPKLADFGIAKWSADDSKDGQRAEDTAIVAGQKLAMYSPSWAAPEQLAGQPVSPATDIYSLAVVAIYMLTGKAIFADEDVYAGYKKRRNAEQHVREALGPLGIPQSVIDLFIKALAFDPKQRLADVDALASQLQAAIEPQPPTEEQRRITTPLPGQDPTASLKPITVRPETGFGAVQPVTPTVPHAAVTPPDGTPVSRHGYPVQRRTEDFIADRDAPPEPAHDHVHDRSPRPAAAMPAAPLPHAWEPPTIRGPWMASAPSPTGPPHRLPLVDGTQIVGDRRVHFLPAMEGPVDVVGGQASKLRVSFLGSPTGARVIHVKGMSCFVAHLGGRPSPAVQLDQPSDIALVTPRAQEIGHVRVASGSQEGNFLVFSLGNYRVAVAAEDCSDPILFDFGPGSDAYFIYTRGRVLPKPRRR